VATVNEPANEPTLVSVLLPCCDQTYAVQTRVIPAVLAQTHADWELIVVSERQNNTRMRAVSTLAA
jgi:hypothetical protein